MLLAAFTESDVKNPESCVREETGYVSDDKTPDRISAGFCQLLISTAREIMKNPAIDRAWLMNVGNSLDACASYILHNHDHKATDWDPIYVACAYNAGGLYLNAGPTNRWKLRQFPLGTSNHADRLRRTSQIPANSLIAGRLMAWTTSGTGRAAANRGWSRGTNSRWRFQPRRIEVTRKTPLYCGCA
jgi:hypothetical protein